MTIMDLPDGASDQNPSWQQGYSDGEQGMVPSLSANPVYVSGWCHGHNAAHQCSTEDSIAAYHEYW
jgi:hypothetical protein